MSILIIDQSSQYRDEVRSILQDGGFNSFIVVASADEALELLDVDRSIENSLIPSIDLIVADFFNEINDRHSFMQLKELPLLKGVPLIMTGDNTMAEAMQVAFALGAADFVAKPLRKFELLTRCRYALRLRHEIMRRKSRERELLEVTRQLSELNTMLTRLSYVDGLTGVSNRRFFDKALEQEWRRAARGKGEVSLILLDVDFFKRYNDSYGHLRGDDCLQEVAAAIKGALKRPADVLARVGGEEFGIILPDTPKDGALFVGESIRTAVERLGIEHHQSDVGSVVTVSIGISSATPLSSSKSETLCAAADKALYLSKGAGRNKVSFQNWSEEAISKKTG